MDKKFNKINCLSKKSEIKNCQVCGKELTDKSYYDKEDSKVKCFSCYYELYTIKESSNIENINLEKTDKEKQLDAVLGLIQHWNIKVPSIHNNRYRKGCKKHAEMILNALNNI